jgi:hypothetical protein
VLYLRVPPLDWLLVRVPPLDRMTLPRFAALVPWGLAVGAALSLDGAMAGRVRSAGWRWLPAAILAVAALFGEPMGLAVHDTILVLLTVIAAGSAVWLWRRPRVLVSLLAVELGCYAVGINPVAAREDRLPSSELVRRVAELQSAEGGRVMGLDGVLPSNLAGRYGLADLRAYDPLRPQPFAEMFGQLGQTDPVLGGPVRLAPPGLCGTWSVRFLVADPGRVVEGWEPVWRGSGGSVWRNPAWLPEVRVVGSAVVGGWDLVMSGTVDFSTSTVVPAGTRGVAADRAEISIERAEGSVIEVATDCDGPCLVLVARPWAPGWTVAVDGAGAPLVLANLSGLGVVAPPGTHRVVFDYNPWRWKAGVP